MAGRSLAVAAAGAAVGILMGFFGVGGSSIATPLLSLLGVPPLAAVASPLPATIPGAVIAAVPYVRDGESRPRAAVWSIAGGLPGTIAGALLSRAVGGPALLIASGVVLGVVGVRVMRPIAQASRDLGATRRRNRPLLVGACAAVGFFTGLLANGGGFLLVPLYLLVFGLRMRQAAGTSLVVVAALSIPTLTVHAALGHVRWTTALAYGAGVLPGSLLGGRLSRRVEGPRTRRAFGAFLVAFGAAFCVYRLLR